ncbi:rhodanese-like domain-containing protein [Salipaludibacillus daqingensis]|uniref:rhodanese-like domain-containing protein n=1 Tax=Salipaludibacillus daqingensis TaxID=3041001 RepID=UPI002473D044|nr:rhodanese-like domain-containing protein [Salipaludibacillus daqingensis]
MSRITSAFIGGLLLLLLSACGSQYQADNSVKSDDDSQENQIIFHATEEQDLSNYIIEEEEDEESEDDVPYNEDWNYISTLQLERLLDGLPAESQDRSSYDEVPPEWDGVALIDSRPPSVYASGHINGSINIPDSEFESYKDRLPDDKSTKLIFYCGGTHCPLSGSSAEKAEELGFTDTYVYQEGTPAWKAAGNYFVVDVDHVEEKIMESYVSRDDTDPVLIIDTRTYSGYFDNHIPTAIFVDETQYGNKYQGFAPADKDQEIIVYCGGFFCHKSHVLANELLGDGHRNVKVLAGGMPAWNQAGLPTFGMESSEAEFDVSDGAVDRSITAEAFAEMLDEGGHAIVDVRGDGEVASGMLDGAIHIVDSDILAGEPTVEDKLPSDKSQTILVHCASGARAAGVSEPIVDLGYENVYYLDAAFSLDDEGNFDY